VKNLEIATVLTALLVLMPAVASVAPPPPGGILSSQPRAAGLQAMLTVEVKSNTRNGATVAGDEVTLQLYKGQEQIDSLQAKVGEDGKAVFANVPTGPQRAAVACAKHQNMAFRSQPVPLDSPAAEFSASVQVFDVSTDASGLSIGIHHIMVALRSTSLEFTEYLQLRNSSDRAVIGAQRDDRDRPVVVRILLPAGFRDLTTASYLEPEAVVVTADGFYDTMAVPPGEHQVAFSYKVDIGPGTVKIVKGIALPTSELLVFWEHGQGKLTGLGEPNDRLVNAEGLPIEYYRRSGLKPGENLAFEISGFHVKESDASTWVILAAVFAVIVLIAILRLRPRSAGPGRQHE
jgi:hypothetical protein